jgi:hypothetical protein
MARFAQRSWTTHLTQSDCFTPDKMDRIRMSALNDFRTRLGLLVAEAKTLAASREIIDALMEAANEVEKKALGASSGGPATPHEPISGPPGRQDRGRSPRRLGAASDPDPRHPARSPEAESPGR